MSLRLRLILAFFLLSVVPLGALTLYVHASNSRAMRETAGRETELLAGELSQRMQVVTARLTEQVEHLVELAESNEAATEAARRAVQQSVAVTRVQSAAATEAADDAVAGTLGQLAMLLNNVELRDSFRGRGAGGGGRGGRGQGRRGEAPGPGSAATARLLSRRRSLRRAPAAPPPPVPPRVEAGRGRGEPRIGPPPPAGTPGGRGPAPVSPGDPPADERITIDMRPIRLDILRQYASRTSS